MYLPHLKSVHPVSKIKESLNGFLVSLIQSGGPTETPFYLGVLIDTFECLYYLPQCNFTEMSERRC